MTPTPEDIALAVRIKEIIWCSNSLHIEESAQLIAAHTAPLRERIKELERFATPLVSTTANATSQVINHESVGTVLGEKLRRQHQEMRELAEIGRLAVEARRLYGTESGEWFTAECALGRAADAYLAKQEESKP